MPYNPKKFVEAARKLGYRVSARKTVFLATGKDRTGAVASICSKLAAAGINMVAMDAVLHKNEGATARWVLDTARYVGISETSCTDQFEIIKKTVGIA